MKISIVRGAFLNPFELQNFYPLKRKHHIKAISSRFPINEKIDLPLTELWSPTDVPNFPYKYPVLNRLFIDAHYLYGLEKEIAVSDIVHVAETYFHYTIQAIRAKQKGLIKKIVSTCWEIIPHNNETIHGRKEFKRLAYENIDHFICPTDLARRALRKEGVTDKKISVIRVGVDLKRFKSVRRKTHKELVVLFVGRLTEEKGVRELLTAFRLIRNQGFKIKLTMIGSGPLVHEARASGAAVKSVPYEKIHLEYQQGDIFCLPSKNTQTWQEQYGMVSVEAMASGLPIITSGKGATKEVCADAALYVKNTQELSEAISKLASDRQLLIKMRQKSLARAKIEFDSKIISRQIEKIYLSI